MHHGLADSGTPEGLRSILVLKGAGDTHIVCGQSPKRDLSQQPKEIKKEKLSRTLYSKVGGMVQGTC